MKTPTYRDLNDYKERTGTTEIELANALGIGRFALRGFFDDRYPRVLTDERAARIASLLNQPLSYVRKLYAKAA